MMDPAIKTKWVAALRSGKYAQGRHHLKRISPGTNELQFCCLGILCDLHSQETGVEWVNDLSGRFSYLADTGGLSKDVLKWSGLTQGLGDPVKLGVHSRSLSYFNDTSVPFTEIADLIEEQL